MFYYTTYGLTVLSELPLPELETCDVRAQVNVVIRFGEVDRVPPAVVRQNDYFSGNPCFHARPEEAYFFWEAAGAFLVRGGREMIIEPAPGVEEPLLRLIILGVALATLLQQRGLLVLHASAVEITGEAVAFLGQKGEGKSTTAAALHAHGCPIIADDLAVIRVDNEANPMTLPGFPQLKLWPEAAAAVGDEPETLPRLHPELEKRARRITTGFSQIPLPLRCIYVLADGTDLEVELLSYQEAFLELMRYSAALRFLGSSGTTPTHFRRCAGLAGLVPIFRLSRPRSLAALPDFARWVENHVIQELSAPACTVMG